MNCQYTYKSYIFEILHQATGFVSDFHASSDGVYLIVAENQAVSVFVILRPDSGTLLGCLYPVSCLDIKYVSALPAALHCNPDKGNKIPAFRYT